MLLKDIKEFADLLIDSYFVVDAERNIVDFNQAFHAMLPRQVARTLKSRKCYEVLKLEVCERNCVAKKCWATGQHVRLDEIRGTVEGGEEEMRFILSAIPIHDEQGRYIGAIEMQRNVTDEAAVQNKYQQQVETTEAKLSELETCLKQRTRRLLEVGKQLAESQEAVLRARTDLFPSRPGPAR